jgi:hypothetical protein
MKIEMKKLLWIPLAIAVFSCSDDPKPIQACNVDNVFDLPWLDQEISEMEDSEFGREYNFIAMGIYNSQTIFEFGNCCPTCNSVYPVKDCTGNTLGAIGQNGITYDQITERKIIWKSSTNSCAI